MSEVKTLDTSQAAYSIGDISRITGISEDTLRYYERDGLLSGIRRLANGHRRYSEHDLEWLRFILCLRSTGMPLGKIREYKGLMEQGDATAVDRKNLLVGQREKIQVEMAALRTALERITHKIEYYESIEANLNR